MQVGFVGLGRMGANMADRLRTAGHEVIGYDVDPSVSEVESLADLVARLVPPRPVWIMVPIAAIDQTVDELGDLLEPGDVVIEGGNSRWTDDQQRAARLSRRGVGFVDCGVSGGVWGVENGYALMVGGAEEHVHTLMPLFEALKPTGDAGFVHVGPTGAGHFAKMVHNGIEYGLMQCYAEGYELLQSSALVSDVRGVLESWTAGTVVRSWLLELAVLALREDSELSSLRGYADDSGMGRWTVEAGIAQSVPTPAISAALYARFASRQDDSPAMRLVAALRREFGGHSVTEAAPPPEDDADEPAPSITPEGTHAPLRRNS